MLTTEYERIMKDSGCDWLDELVTNNLNVKEKF